MSFPDSGAQQSAAMHAHLEQVAEHGALGAAQLQLRQQAAMHADTIASFVTQTLELVKVRAERDRALAEIARLKAAPG